MKKIKKKIFSLGGAELTNAFEDKKKDDFNIDSYAKSNNLKLTDDYKFFSETYGFHQFNNDVVFESIEKLPVTSENNLCPLDFIYGWGDGSNSLQDIRETFLEQIPEKYFVFAEGVAGDQLCIDQENQKIYYWNHESLEGEGIYLVADSFMSFIEKLQINKDVVLDDDIEEEWFADDF